MRDQIKQVAEETYFDPANCDAIDSEDTQGAIEDICGEVAGAASPGYSFGRSGNIPSNTWLYNEGVPSNKAGHAVRLTTPRIRELNISSEDIDTFDITIYEHEGDEVNLTSLVTVNIIAARGDTFGVDVAMTAGRQLAARLTSGSAKNVIVDLTLKGSI